MHLTVVVVALVTRPRPSWYFSVSKCSMNGGFNYGSKTTLLDPDRPVSVTARTKYTPALALCC